LLVVPIIKYVESLRCLLNGLKTDDIKKTMTQQLKQKTKSSELLDRINSLTTEKNVSLFTLKRFRKEADLLISQVNTPESYVALGAICTLQKDVDAVHSAFRRAIAKFGCDGELSLNYAVSLRKLGFFSDAHEYVIKAYEFREGDLTVINELILCAFELGLIREAKQWLEQWEKERPNETKQHSIAGILNAAYEIVSDNNISDESVMHLFTSSVDLLHEYRIFTKVSMSRILHDDDSDWLSYEFSLPLDTDKIVDLNFTLADKLVAANLADTFNNKIVVRFTAEQ